jgi:hypothetical protein
VAVIACVTRACTVNRVDYYDLSRETLTPGIPNREASAGISYAKGDCPQYPPGIGLTRSSDHCLLRPFGAGLSRSTAERGGTCRVQPAIRRSRDDNGQRSEWGRRPGESHLQRRRARPADSAGRLAHAARVVGWPEERGRTLIDKLNAVATAPEFVYRHEWAVNDLVMWDNRCCLHRGRPWDGSRFRRVMRRTTIAGAAPTVARACPGT